MNDPALVGTVPQMLCVASAVYCSPFFFNCLSTSKDGRGRGTSLTPLTIAKMHGLLLLHPHTMSFCVDIYTEIKGVRN
jgi:hypothetical protein